MEEKRLTVDIPEELHRRLKMRCAQLGMELKEKIRELIEKYLEEDEKWFAHMRQSSGPTKAAKKPKRKGKQ